MKKNLHPELQDVIFQDMVTGDKFLIKSTATSKETAAWTDGKTYPLIKVEVSSKSHPTFKGESRQEVASSRAKAFGEKFGRLH